MADKKTQKKYKQDPRNARIHSEKNKEAIRKSLDTLRAGRSILVDADDVIIGGNATYEGAQALGIPTMEIETDGEVLVVVKRTDLHTDDAERKMLALGDNQISTLAEWEKDMRDTLLEEAGLDVSLAGFEVPDKITEPKEKEPKPKEAEALMEKWGTETGQLWVVGRHRILCGDATDAKCWKRLMAGERAELCHTDPPYGVSYEGSDEQWTWAAIDGDDKRDDDLMANLLIPVFKHAMKHTTPDAAFYIWHASATRRDFEAAIDALGLIERQYIIWVKDRFVLGHADYHHQVEPLFYCGKAGKAVRWFGNREQSTTWRLQPSGEQDMTVNIANGLRISDGMGDEIYLARVHPKGKKIRLLRITKKNQALFVKAAHDTDGWEVRRDKPKDVLHPTQKPAELFGIPMKNHTLEGDIVIEPFSGSGAQFVAAEMMGRRCFGMDIEPRWVAVAIERLHRLGLKPKKEAKRK